MSNESPTDAQRLVPVEPTPEIIRAMCIAVENGEFMDPADPAWVDGYDAWIPSVKAAWKDALAAASASPLPGGGQLSKNLGELDEDVVRLVIAARRVAYEGAAEDDLRALDIAAEAFASRVPWEDEPDELPAAPTGDA